MDLELRFGKRAGDGSRRGDDGAGGRRILVLGDFGGRQSRGVVAPGDGLAQRPFVRVRPEAFDEAVAAVAPRLALPAAVAGSDAPLELRSLDDLHPDALLRALPIFRNPPPAAPVASGVATVTEGDAGDLARLLGRAPTPAAAKPRTAAEMFIKEIVDRQQAGAPAPAAPADPAALAPPLRAVLRDARFQSLDATWRALELLVSRGGDDADIWLLDVSRDELALDLLAPDVAQSGLGRRLLAPPGGRGFSAVVADFAFGPGAKDVAMLEGLGALAALIDAPVVTGGDSTLLGLPSLAGQADALSWPGLAKEDQQRWDALRHRPEAVRVALALPRFLARPPYGARTAAVDAFAFEEVEGRPDADALCWANGAYLCAIVLTRARAEVDDDVVPSGEIDDLPFFTFRADGEAQMYPVAEVTWGDHAADRASDRGLIALVGVRDRNAVRVAPLRAMSDPPVAL